MKIDKNTDPKLKNSDRAVFGPSNHRSPGTVPRCAPQGRPCKKKKHFADLHLLKCMRDAKLNNNLNLKAPQHFNFNAILSVDNYEINVFVSNIHVRCTYCAVRKACYTNNGK